MSLGHGASIVRSGLVLHLDAANRKSYPGTGTAWTDLSGNGNHGDIINGTTFSNNAFLFDGTNDHVKMASLNRKFAWTPSGTVGNRIVSIETWVKTSDTAGCIFSKPWNGSGNYNLMMYHNSFYTRIDNAHSLSFSSIADNKWHHIVCIVNETQKAVYIDGLLVAGFVNHLIVNDTPTPSEQVLPLTLMTLYPYPPGEWNEPTHAISGSMSVFRFYNKQLNIDEIQQNFNALRGRYGI